MQDQTNQFQDLDRVLYNAQHRRTADLLGWLKQFLRGRRRARVAGGASLPDVAPIRTSAPGPAHG